MKVLITGASGFLGSYLVKLFVGAGHEVRALVRRSSRSTLLKKLRVQIMYGDLKDPHSLQQAVEGMHTVVHAAATMSGPAQEYVAATCRGTRDLIAAAEAAGVSRFIHISSIIVLSTQQTGTEPIPEDAPYETSKAFLTPYTRSKLEAEQAVLNHARKSAMAILVLRPGLLFGPRGKMFLPRTGYALGKNWYLVIGNGRNPLPVCYVRNCATAVLAAAEKQTLTQGVFNILDDVPVTQLEYLREIKYGARPALKIVRVPYFLARCAALLGETASKITRLPWPIRSSHLAQCRRRLRYSNAKARQLLGWKPETGKDEALSATSRYFLEKESFSRRADIRFLGQLPTDAKPLKACLIGCGMIGRVHAAILDRAPHARLVGVCDADREAASRLANRFNIPHTYTDPQTMLENLKPDVVHVLTPPQSHADLAGLAAKHGCHVLVEKPMAVDAADARRIAETARRHGVKVCVNHNHLYDPVFVAARKMLELRELGDILWVESYYGFDLGHNLASRYMVPGGENHWTFDLPGGLFQNLAPHPLSLALAVLGAPAKIAAHARHGRVLPHAASDELRVLLETPTASGLVTVSLAASPRFQYLNIFGTQRCLFIDLLNKWAVTQSVMKGVPKPISRALMNIRHGRTLLCGTLRGMLKVLLKRWTPYEGLDILTREFYRSILLNEPAPVTADDGVQVMEIMDEIWRQIAPLKSSRPDTRD